MKKLYFLIITFCSFNGLNAQDINFPDVNLKNMLMSSYGPVKNSQGVNMSIDTNKDGKIQVSEALNVYYLDLKTSLNLRERMIKDMTGIEFFTNAIELDCTDNNFLNLDVSKLNKLKILKVSNIKTLDVSGLTNLEELSIYARAGFTEFNSSDLTSLKKIYIQNTDLVSLDFRHLKNLEEVSVTANYKLTSLNLFQLPKLKTIDCRENKLETLNILGDVSLENLVCDTNKINSLDLTGLTKLKNIVCPLNQIVTLDVSGMKNLTMLNCRDNLLTSLNVTNTNLSELDFSGNKLTSITLPYIPISSFYAQNNLLETIDLKNGVKDIMSGIYFNLGNQSTLKYICTDEVDWYEMQELRSRNNAYKFEYNSYCSFVPGGNVYYLKGSQKFDSDNNGCDASDIVFPNLKFDITNGKATSTFISTNSGNYSIAVGDGTHKVTPKIENPNYFKITPESYSVQFPNQTSPNIQDFCVTPNGIHNDLEIVILPLNVVRPGFEAYYKIVYKNKGNVKQSGSVYFKFDNKVLKYISSKTAPANITDNVLEWSFANLQPFENREILITLEANRPTDVPPVNTGDILTYSASIISPDADELPNDNNFVLNHTVLGSFDPNDKTCLEGSVISSGLIGEYVHYMIRFENIGTYFAQNVVVKDIIDLSKFDISTLVTTSSSHSFVTRISEGNKVEFIFENINLPFDDANNDGYIAFKIKTKSTLKVGDTFTNDANIYFDYNFPVLTNKASSTFKTLDRADFEFSKYFSVYPNPSSEVLNIVKSENIEIKSYEIYNVLGQLVLAVPNVQTVSSIDISRLASGNYFIKIKSDKGSSSMKFIKN